MRCKINIDENQANSGYLRKKIISFWKICEMRIFILAYGIFYFGILKTFFFFSGPAAFKKYLRLLQSKIIEPFLMRNVWMVERVHAFASFSNQPYPCSSICKASSFPPVLII